MVTKTTAVICRCCVTLTHSRFCDCLDSLPSLPAPSPMSSTSAPHHPTGRWLHGPAQCSHVPRDMVSALVGDHKPDPMPAPNYLLPTHVSGAWGSGTVVRQHPVVPCTAYQGRRYRHGLHLHFLNDFLVGLELGGAKRLVC